MKGPSTVVEAPATGEGDGPSRSRKKKLRKRKRAQAKLKGQQETPSATYNGNVGVSNGPRTVSGSGSEVDPAQLSAYAVYNNQIPGVKSFQDTSKPTEASKKKRNKKNAALKLKLKSVGVGNNKQSQVFGNKKKTNNVTSVEKSLVNGTVDASAKDNKTKKKRKAKKKSEQLAVDVSGESLRRKDLGGHENSTIEPPNKVRKVDYNAKLLPNPLSIAESDVANPGHTTGPSETGAEKRKNKAKKIVLNTESKKTAGVEEETSVMPNIQSPSKDKKKKVNEVEYASVTNSIREASDEPPNLQDILDGKIVKDSTQHGRDLFEWLIYPQTFDAFFDEFWEKDALLIKRGQLYPDYYERILSSAKLDDILRRNVLKFTKNVDVVYYEKGERFTVSEDMNHRVRPAVLWDYYSTGNSIRVLNPQSYCPSLNRLNSNLQELFGTFVGANVYLTPPGSQGFAPHWDDIEAFVLQLEGKKRWKLYKPRNPNEVLPRYSSKDFGMEEETLGKPFVDVILEAGDMLYFPRGVIHQAKTVEGHHSMHITLSCYQQNSWADLLKHHFAKVVDNMAATDVEFRKGLPLDFLSYMGLAASKKTDSGTLSKRSEFKSHMKGLFNKLSKVDADIAADEMGKKLMWDALPPFLTRKEKDRTIIEDGEFLNGGIVKHRVEIDPDNKVKIVRKHCVRLVTEADGLRLYYTVENPMVYHEDEIQFLEISEEFQEAIEYLINSYPAYVKIEDLPMPENDLTKKLQVVTDLWEHGILITERPLETAELDGVMDVDEDGDVERSDDGSDFGSDLEGFIEADSEEDCSFGHEFIDDEAVESLESHEESDESDDDAPMRASLGGMKRSFTRQLSSDSSEGEEESDDLAPIAPRLNSEDDEDDEDDGDLEGFIVGDDEIEYDQEEDRYEDDSE